MIGDTTTKMIGLPKRALSPIPIEHHSQQRWNLKLSSSKQTTLSLKQRRRRNRNRKSATQTLTSTKRSYSLGALRNDTADNIHGIPNLQRYIAPSRRATMQEVPTSYVQHPATNGTGRRRAAARAETLRREKYALRALAKHTGLGTTKVRFRSNRVGGEVALTQVSTKWQEETLRDSDILRRQRSSDGGSSSNSSSSSSGGDANPETHQQQHQQRLPTPREIDSCLQALEMLPSHLAVVVPTLRRALYSNSYVGLASSNADDLDNTTTVLDTLPYYKVAQGLETSNGYLLADMEELKHELEKVKDDRNDQRSLLKKSNSKNQELREKVNKREDDNITLRKQLLNMREIASDHLEDNNNTTKRYVDLDIQHSTLRTKFKDVSGQLSDLREVYSSVSNELSHALRTCGQLSNEGKEYRKQLDESSKTLAEHANLKAQYEQLSLEHDNTKEELEMIRDDMKRHSNRKASKALVQMGMLKQ